MSHAGRVGKGFLGPGTESLQQLAMKVGRQSKLGMDGRAAALGSQGIMHIGVATGAHSNGHILLSLLGQNVGQRRSQQYLMATFRDGRQVGLQNRYGLVGIVFGKDHVVGSQSVDAGVAAGDQAGGVGAGNGGENRMVPGEGHSLAGPASQIRHELGDYLGWLQPIENHDQDLRHTAPVQIFEVERPSTSSGRTEKSTAPSPLMGEGWDEGDTPHLTPLPQGERKPKPGRYLEPGG